MLNQQSTFVHIARHTNEITFAPVHFCIPSQPLVQLEISFAICFFGAGRTPLCACYYRLRSVMSVRHHTQFCKGRIFCFTHLHRVSGWRLQSNLNSLPSAAFICRGKDVCLPFCGNDCRFAPCSAESQQDLRKTIECHLFQCRLRF